MNKCNSIRAIDKTDLSEQTKFWLDVILSKKLIKENHAVKNQVNMLQLLIR